MLPHLARLMYYTSIAHHRTTATIITNQRQSHPLIKLFFVLAIECLHKKEWIHAVSIDLPISSDKPKPPQDHRLSPDGDPSPPPWWQTPLSTICNLLLFISLWFFSSLYNRSKYSKKLDSYWYLRKHSVHYQPKLILCSLFVFSFCALELMKMWESQYYELQSTYASEWMKIYCHWYGRHL